MLRCFFLQQVQITKYKNLTQYDKKHSASGPQFGHVYHNQINKRASYMQMISARNWQGYPLSLEKLSFPQFHAQSKKAFSSGLPGQKRPNLSISSFKKAASSKMKKGQFSIIC